MADNPFSGIQDKDLANFCRDLARRGYDVRRMGTGHFQAFWKGEYTHCRIPLTPRGPGAFTRVKAAIKRFERSHGMYAEPVKSGRPKARTAAKRKRRIFVMPEPGDVSDRRPASIAPSQYTVATMLGSDAMMKLAEAILPERKEKIMTQRRSWTLEEKAAIVKRYRDAVKVQGGESLLKELGIYNSHITSFTQQLRQNGWDPDATPVIEEPRPEYTFETVEVPEPVIPFETVPEDTGVVVTEPVFDPDEEITTLTAQWSDLVTRKRELSAAQEGLSATIDRLLTQAEEVAQQRDQVTAEAADVAAGITKVRKRLAEMVRED